jgi:hypothetical protein
MAWGANVHHLEAALSVAKYQDDRPRVEALSLEIRAYQATCDHQVSPEQGRTHCWRCGLDMARPALAKTRPMAEQLIKKAGT